MAFYSEKKTIPCEVLVHAQVVEEAARQQIEIISQHPVISGLVAVMPDCLG